MSLGGMLNDRPCKALAAVHAGGHHASVPGPGAALPGRDVVVAASAGVPADAKRAWDDGYKANKFNPWGKRCQETLDLVAQGQEPPRS